LPDTLPTPDYSVLHGNIAFANELMNLMMMAQARQSSPINNWTN
jgi:hypothetical protein